jgi:peptidoglycan/LPS O-acetylase OafA/YrhL
MKIQYRPEIDGLRAIAIISIVVYHSNFLIFEKNILPGGFLGVDIFFIISGYLITSIIFKEWEINNNFSLINFYERRARRIFPALIIVILLSFPFAYHYLLATSFINYSQSIISAISFASNFFFWYTKHQYNGPIAIENPFLHTWSLSVEEQFYIIFPIFLIFILKYLKKKIFIILLSIIFISLTLSQIGSKIAPSFNFFFTSFTNLGTFTWVDLGTLKL